MYIHILYTYMYIHTIVLILYVNVAKYINKVMKHV